MSHPQSHLGHIALLARSVGALVEAALYMTVLFIVVLIWIVEQAWEVSVRGLDGTPWARQWREGRPG